MKVSHDAIVRATTLEAVGEYVCVELHLQREHMTQGGILLPESLSASNAVLTGTVQSIGSTVKNRNLAGRRVLLNPPGVRAPFTWSRDDGTEITCAMLHEQAVMALIPAAEGIEA